MNNILIVGAHFDDAELGVGGTAAKLSSLNAKVYKLTLTDNVTDFERMKISVDYESSRLQSTKACEVLGIKELNDFSPIECNHLEYKTCLMKKIEDYIYDLEIDTIFMHFNADMNTDHVAASRLCLTAGRHCNNILQYQSNGYILDNVYYPTFFVDISDFIGKKIEALSCYGKEHDRYGSLFEVTINKNQVWGYANHVKYAEGFNVIKLVI